MDSRKKPEILQALRNEKSTLYDQTSTDPKQWLILDCVTKSDYKISLLVVRQLEPVFGLDYVPAIPEQSIHLSKSQNQK